MRGNWLDTFQKKHELILFKKIDINHEGIVYFEKKNSYEWFVKIDETNKTITLPKLIPNSYRERELKEKQIIVDLLDNISEWDLIGLSKHGGTYEISKIILSNYKYIAHYSEKESLNAFGNLDWSEF